MNPSPAVFDKRLLFRCRSVCLTMFELSFPIALYVSIRASALLVGRVQAAGAAPAITAGVDAV